MSGKPKKDDTMKRLLALFVTIMPLVFTTAARADLRDGLVGYWPFDGDPKDYSGNNNHGTTHGVSLTSDRHGNCGGAYYFGGYYDNGFKNEGYIAVPNSSSLHAIGHSFTFAAWVRIDAWCMANGGGGTYHDYWVSIICKGYANRQYSLQFQSYGSVENCWVGADSFFPAVVPALKSWHHVAVTDDGTQLVEYVDGIFVSSGNIGGEISKNSESLYVGKDKPGDLEYFNGAMDDLVIYNRALSSSEIKALYDGDLKVCTISFDANGGDGNMAAQKALTDTTLALPANTFTREGYLFQGWATSPDGPVVYSDGAEITVDSDKTLYAVWKAEGGMIQLSVARADPAAGSLTLAWEEEKPIEGMTYSVWRGTGDERSAAVCVAPSVTGNTWTDEEYWKAEPVLEPLRYWVVADAGGKNERESNCVETRHRMGLCVGFDAYGTKATPHRQSLADASLCKAQAEGAKFSMKPVLKNSAASVDGIHNALAELAEEAKPGDTVLFYIATHGGVSPSKNKAVLTAYNGHYTVSQLATDVAAFHSDVGFIGIIMACHSRALSDGSVLSPGDELNWFLENGLAECKANVGWVTSCGMDESSWNLAGSKQTMFGEWFLNQGWKNGYADRKLSGVGYGGGNGDGTHTALELARYAEAFSRGVSDDKPSHVFYQNEALLGKTIMATEVASGGANIPTAPTTVTASQVEFDSKIYVSWASSSGALWYWLEGKMENSVDAWKCLSYETRGTDFQHTESLVGQNYQYRVRAVNGAGASGFSPIATGSRGTVPFIDWLRGKGEQIGLSGTAAELATMSSANGMSLEACYVSGIDPLDASAAFKAKLAREDGKWTAKPEGGEKEGRVYRVEGKREMTDDEDWTDLTDVEDVEAEGWHFFRVGVELAE